MIVELEKHLTASCALQVVALAKEAGPCLHMMVSSSVNELAWCSADDDDAFGQLVGVGPPPVHGDETYSSGSESDAEGEGGEGGLLDLSEEVISTVQEVSNLPRHEVISLLLEHNGDPNSVLSQLYV